jgi:hypothetical protein
MTEKISLNTTVFVATQRNELPSGFFFLKTQKLVGICLKLEEKISLNGPMYSETGRNKLLSRFPFLKTRNSVRLVVLMNEIPN